jgi:hypothetical protein
MRLGKPFLLLSLPGVYPDTSHFHSAFELAAGLRTAQAGLSAAWQQARSNIVGRVPKRPQMFASRNGFPYK